MMLFLKLINSSFKRNLKVYVPYLISMTMLVAINYIFKAVEINRSLKDLPSATVTKALMQTGSTFIILVTLAFMIYVNRFLWQQRQQEMGLYSMLGMTRHNLQVLTVIEKCYLLVISLFLGTLFGIIFDRLAFLGFAHLLQIDHLSQPWIEWGAVINTIVIIGGFFLILMVIDLIKLFQLNPNELYHPQQTKIARHGKFFTFAGLLGVAVLAYAYYLTITVKPRISALTTFMTAVFLVVIGTYLIFIAGSIIVLKLLQKNKGYYYRPRHFIAVSGMLQRMEQNGASLATICLLCSSVLVILFTSLTMYAGINDTVNSYAPRDLTIITSQKLTAQQESTINSVAKKHHAQLNKPVTFTTSAPQYGYWENNRFINQGNLENMTNQTTNTVITMSTATYNQITDKHVKLAANKALIYSPAKEHRGALQIGTQKYQATPIYDFHYYFNPSHAIYSPIFIITNMLPANTTTINFTGINYHLNGSKKAHLNFENDLQAQLHLPNQVYSSRTNLRSQLTSLYGGIVFLGILISFALGITTTVVIYFKQITEGYEDQYRFKTMQQVGLSEKETTKSIHSQVLMVFMLPVVGAIINLCFAIPAIRQILIQFNFYNVRLMIIIAVSITFILLCLYFAIYGLTTRMYRKIVEQG
ncbi:MULTISPECIES: ABC transporter permease [Limosilactobacillus]|uniref:ABC transporter permease n=1 Tax=Limosilactobacillus reuteri TaxID=1598 RepID=A0ABD6XE14_LIMRT|nr:MULTISPECIES: FtsX-like permease family protein [Limosilactobacillus]MBB1070820.1 FtsX-like permease family protein [Limosilactobacillus reuteri]MCC4510598.1 FtsX-like permease family protein [Limosilactobacillus reuteri]MCC4511886.1 FtsX-like permease family protein [Limosilactobacillus reuteri]MDD1401832.1 FtsX-like permease family protein [Limosilactobacillus reuteri]MQB63695.1 ABC transporter permease [Limosilactobacillus reuteri]